eukprot:gene10935-14681_t
MSGMGRTEFKRQNSIQSVKSTDEGIIVDRVFVPASSMVRTKAIIRMVDDVDTSGQSFFAALWVGSTDSSIPFENSSTNSFQNSYDKRLVNQNIFPSDYNLLPKWNITLLNSKSTENSYTQNKLPSYRRWVNPVADKEIEFYNDMNWNAVSSDDNNPRFYQRLQLKTLFANPFDLETFPYDIQVLNIHASLDTPMSVACFDTAWMAETFFEINEVTGKISLREESKNCVQYDSAYKNILEKTEWKTLMIYVESAAQEPTGNKRDSDTPLIEKDVSSMYHRFIVSIVIQRNAWHHNSTVLIPLIIVLVASCATFFVGGSFERITYVSTLLLTVFSLKWFTSSNMPKISHNTIFDSFFIVTYGYLIFAIALAIYINIINPPNSNTTVQSPSEIMLTVAYFTTVWKGFYNGELFYMLLQTILLLFSVLVMELIWWLCLCFVVGSQYVNIKQKENKIDANQSNEFIIDHVNKHIDACPEHWNDYSGYIYGKMSYIFQKNTYDVFKFDKKKFNSIAFVAVKITAIFFLSLFGLNQLSAMIFVLYFTVFLSVVFICQEFNEVFDYMKNAIKYDATRALINLKEMFLDSEITKRTSGTPLGNNNNSSSLLSLAQLGSQDNHHTFQNLNNNNSSHQSFPSQDHQGSIVRSQSKQKTSIPSQGRTSVTRSSSRGNGNVSIIDNSIFQPPSSPSEYHQTSSTQFIAEKRSKTPIPERILPKRTRRNE